MSNIRSKTRILTQTALFLAIAIAAQFLGAQLGGAGGIGQIITGSVVNLCLICAVVLTGWISGISIAVLSPVLAFFLGVMKVPFAIPVVIIGNLLYIVICKFSYGFTEKKIGNLAAQSALNIVFTALAACVKAAGMWLSLNFLFVSFFNEKQLAMLSASFSLPQVITGSIAGVIAAILLPALKKTRKENA